MKKDQVDVSLPEFVTGAHGLLGGVDEPQVNDLGVQAGELVRYLIEISIQPLPQSGKLVASGIEADAEESDDWATLSHADAILCLVRQAGGRGGDIE